MLIRFNIPYTFMEAIQIVSENVYAYGYTDLQIVGAIFYAFIHPMDFWRKKEKGMEKR